MQRIPSTNNKSCHYYGDYMPHRNRLNLANGESLNKEPSIRFALGFVLRLNFVSSIVGTKRLSSCYRAIPSRARHAHFATPDVAVTTTSSTATGHHTGGGHDDHFLRPRRHALARVDPGLRTWKPSVPSSSYQPI